MSNTQLAEHGLSILALPLLRAQEALEEAKRHYVAPDTTVLHCKLARARELYPGGGSGRAREPEGITLDYLAVGPTGRADQWGSEASRGRGGWAGGVRAGSHRRTSGAGRASGLRALSEGLSASAQTALGSWVSFLRFSGKYIYGLVWGLLSGIG